MGFLVRSDTRRSPAGTGTGQEGGPDPPPPPQPLRGEPRGRPRRISEGARARTQPRPVVAHAPGRIPRRRHELPQGAGPALQGSRDRNQADGDDRMTTEAKYSRQDFQTDQEVRWCPGCGDYTILASVQNFMAEMGVDRKDIVFVSGIGCAARFPYYMNAYGMHGIHGRAPAIASGLAVARPEPSVWVVSGDGDAMSIGGNHLIHSLRRNINIKILLFNNQIYGLTKGQYSPTSEAGKRTKSSPAGSIDFPFNPVSLALGAEATFVARTIDMDRAHTTEILKQAYQHRRFALLEVLPNRKLVHDKGFA